MPLPSPMAEVPKELPACDYITVRTFMRRMCAIWMATSSLLFAAVSDEEIHLQMTLTSFGLGKLKIASHVREELDRAGITAQSIQIKSGGIETPPGTARLTIVVNGIAASLDLKANEVEDCEFIVAGEPWHKIAAFIGRLAR